MWDRKKIYKILKSKYLKLDELFKYPKYVFKKELKVINQLSENDFLYLIETEWINCSLHKLEVDRNGELKFEFSYIMCDSFIFIHENAGNFESNLIHELETNLNYNDKFCQSTHSICEKMQRKNYLSIFIKRFNINMVKAYSYLNQYSSK